MPRFSYKAKDHEGTTKKGLVEAANIKQACHLLHEKNYFIIDIEEARPKALSINLTKSKINRNDLVHLTRQLSTMLTAGLTLIETLSILQQQMNKPSLVKLINRLEDGVRGGKTFADVLERYPKVFRPIYLALVRAGEVSGKLDVILENLADNLEKSQKFRNKVRGALIYPSIIITGMAIVSVIVMTVVVPRLKNLYKEFGVDLPLPTQILIAMSTFSTKYWIILLAILIISVLSFLKFKQTWTGKHILASISLSLPIFGPIIKQSTLVELIRTLSILVSGGVPILTSLEISRDATNNILYQEAFASASKKVEKGFPLSDSLPKHKLFPPIFGQMVSVGEQTGKLGETLFKLSRYFETEADNAVRTLTTMIEPLIMIVLGLGVGFLVMAVLLPIYSLTSSF